MKRPVQEPTPTGRKSVPDGIEYEHPAFAQIQASRVSGGHPVLYDSDLKHHGYIVVRIAKSTLTRGLSRDWHHGSITPWIEVAMSEAQWATFVSSLNIGTGVPCTLQWKDGETIPALPPRPIGDEFNADMEERLRKPIDTLASTIKAIEAMDLPVGKKTALLNLVKSAKQNLQSNVPFVAESFKEHMEESVEKAKAEVHGHVQRIIQRAGLKHLGADPVKLAITGPTSNDEESTS